MERRVVSVETEDEAYEANICEGKSVAIASGSPEGVVEGIDQLVANGRWELRGHAEVTISNSREEQRHPLVCVATLVRKRQRT